jgi:hypothetical protein
MRNVPRPLQTTIGGVTPLPGLAARTLPPPTWGRVPIKTAIKAGPTSRTRQSIKVKGIFRSAPIKQCGTIHIDLFECDSQLDERARAGPRSDAFGTGVQNFNFFNLYNI